jgi:hypothetical protein
MARITKHIQAMPYTCSPVYVGDVGPNALYEVTYMGANMCTYSVCIQQNMKPCEFDF